MRDLPFEFEKDSVQHKILSAAAVIGICTILTQIVGFTRELTVAAWFGTADAFDAFLIGLLVPAFVVNVLAGSLSASFLPMFIRIHQEKGLGGAQGILTAVITWFFLFGVALSLLLLVLAPFYLPILCSGFSPEKLRLTKFILFLLLPIILLKGLSTIYAGVLNSLENFALAAALPALVPLLSIIFIFILGAYLGIYALVGGTVLGFGLETFLLGCAISRRNLSLRPRLIRFDSDIKAIAAQFLPIAAGALIMGGTELVDKSMAAALVPGSVAALNYGNKIIAAVLTLATTAIGTAVLPYFSKMVAAKEWDTLRKTIKFYLGLIFILGIPAALFIYFFSGFLVELVFQRGSFTPEDTVVVSSVQALFTFQIPFYVASIVVVRLISSLRANHILMWGAAINLAANIGLNVLFIYFMGLKGIALSTSCVYFISFIYLFYFAAKRIKREIPKNSGPV